MTSLSSQSSWWLSHPFNGKNGIKYRASSTLTLVAPMYSYDNGFIRGFSERFSIPWISRLLSSSSWVVVCIPLKCLYEWMHNQCPPMQQILLTSAHTHAQNHSFRNATSSCPLSSYWGDQNLATLWLSPWQRLLSHFNIFLPHGQVFNSVLENAYSFYNLYKANDKPHPTNPYDHPIYPLDN